MPAVINDAQDKQFKAMFKKQYSTIAQAIQMVYAKNGTYITPAADGWEKWPYCVCEIGKELKSIGSGIKCEVLSNNQNYTTNSIPKNSNIHNCTHEVFIDVNGYKKPNTVGRDIFYFFIKDNQFTPVFWTNDTGNSANGCSCPNYCTLITRDNYKEDCETGSGWGCSPLYIME